MTEETTDQRVARLEAEVRGLHIALRRLTFVLEHLRTIGGEDVAEIWEEEIPLQKVAEPPPRARRAASDKKSPGATAKPPGPTPEQLAERRRKQRSRSGKIGANRRWAMESDRAAATAPAREGRRRKFEDRVDPDRVLPPDERARRVDSAMRAEMQAMSMKSVKARAAKKRGGA